MEALSVPARNETSSWKRRWPQCILLLQLTERCVRHGPSPICHRLLKSLLRSRDRMQGAPPLVDNLLSELWYAAVLTSRGDLAGAQRHALIAGRKARRIEEMIRESRQVTSRTTSADLRQRSERLQTKVHALLKRSDELFSLSIAAQCRARRSSLITR